MVSSGFPEQTPWIQQLYSEEFSVPDMVVAESEWSQCMTSKGYSFHHYDDAEVSIEAEGRNVTASAASEFMHHEVAIATADAWCYINYMHARQWASDTKLLTALVGEYPQYRRDLERALAQTPSTPSTSPNASS
jgi:hypothetical protein